MRGWLVPRMDQVKLACVQRAAGPVHHDSSLSGHLFSADNTIVHFPFCLGRPDRRTTRAAVRFQRIERTFGNKNVDSCMGAC